MTDKSKALVEVIVLQDQPHDGRMLRSGTIDTIEAELVRGYEAGGAVDGNPKAVEAYKAHLAAQASSAEAA